MDCRANWTNCHRAQRVGNDRRERERKRGRKTTEWADNPTRAVSCRALPCRGYVLLPQFPHRDATRPGVSTLPHVSCGPGVKADRFLPDSPPVINKTSNTAISFRSAYRTNITHRGPWAVPTLGLEPGSKCVANETEVLQATRTAHVSAYKQHTACRSRTHNAHHTERVALVLRPSHNFARPSC
jgi:hypothetical protein